MNREDFLTNYFKTISSSKHKGLSPKEEYDLYSRIKKGDKKAADQLAIANLRFVVSVAKRYQNQGIPFEDLVSIGNMGLLKAVKKFDASKNFKFISYAVWWIRQSILQAISSQSRITDIPLNQTAKIWRVRKAVEKLSQKYHKRPSVEEVSEETHYSYYEVEEVLRMDLSSISLDTPLRDGSTTTLSERMESLDNSEDAALSSSRWKAISVALSHLPDREKKILLMYFGFQSQASTLEEIGVHMNMTRERVRQIKEKALNTLRNTRVREILRSLI